VKFNLIYALVFFPLLGYCQEWKNFEILNNKEKFHEYFFYSEQNSTKNNFLNKLILNYQNKTVPIQKRLCPCIPSCSHYTQISIHKHGIMIGIIRGTERLFIRENPSMKSGSFYFQFIWDNPTKKNIYDPVDANNIFKQKDWRIIDPLFINEISWNSSGIKF
jgi:putative component of membrane protein insertase Oxa1/YidC/SpoIIIJ protein YidD